MITADVFSPSHRVNGTARQALIEDPSWRWANKLLGDPLLRADDKDLGPRGERGPRLSRLAASLRDPRTRAEIRLRAERKAGNLQLQLADLRRRGLPELAVEAEQELSDQINYIQAFTDPDV